eukprot:2468298-Pyramimonas_sp.AAC.1
MERNWQNTAYFRSFFEDWRFDRAVHKFPCRDQRPVFLKDRVDTLHSSPVKTPAPMKRPREADGAPGGSKRPPGCVGHRRRLWRAVRCRPRLLVNGAPGGARYAPITQKSGGPSGAQQVQSQGQAQGQQQGLTTMDALSYLREVKEHFKFNKAVYDVFLDIMKEFKARRYVPCYHSHACVDAHECSDA